MKPDNFIKNHSYDLKSLSEEYRQNVIKYKKYGIGVSNIEIKDRIEFNLKYPGLIYTDFSKIADYCSNLYSKYFTDVYTPPRGYVGTSTVLVIGIAPGESKLSFSESTLLFGPSSKTLHNILNFNDGWYFTNVTKKPFVDNKYNDAQIALDIETLKRELRFFPGHRIIFLGKYEPFDCLIEELNLENYIKIKHPSYFSRVGGKGVEEEREKVIEFMK